MNEKITELLARTEPDGDCKIWQGRWHNGQCETKWKGKRMSVQKLIVMLATNEKPTKITKTCGHLNCINPDHFFYEGSKQSKDHWQLCPVCLEKYPYIPQTKACPQCAKSKTLHRQKMYNRKRHHGINLANRGIQRSFQSDWGKIERKLHSDDFYEEYEISKTTGQSVEDYRNQKRKQLVNALHNNYLEYKRLMT